MGNNLDLCQMLGVPNVILCPECGSEAEQDFDDYDVECGHPNPKPGEWTLRASCLACGHEWDLDVIVPGLVLHQAVPSIDIDVKEGRDD